MRMVLKQCALSVWRWTEHTVRNVQNYPLYRFCLEPHNFFQEEICTHGVTRLILATMQSFTFLNYHKNREVIFKLLPNLISFFWKKISNLYYLTMPYWFMTKLVSTYLVLMFLRAWDIPAWMFLILWPSSQTTRSGPGLHSALCNPMAIWWLLSSSSRSIITGLLLADCFFFFLIAMCLANEDDVADAPLLLRRRYISYPIKRTPPVLYHLAGIKLRKCFRISKMICLFW